MPSLSQPTSDFVPLLRPNIRALRPYSSARHEFEGEAQVWLDANENPFASGYNRYPDPLQSALKDDLSAAVGVPADHIFLGNGSDEAIDLLIRMFCRPGVDHILQLPPTYGMYRVSAAISGVDVREVPLDPDFQPDVDRVLAEAGPHSKILFLCSPNNPTGNLMDAGRTRRLLRDFPGMVVVDEAYIDFADRPSLALQLDDHPRLVVLQTFSKAWGLAAARLGIALAQPKLIEFLNKVKPPYNVNQLTQEAARNALAAADRMRAQVELIRSERNRLRDALAASPHIRQVLPSDANFLLAEIPRARELYQHLLGRGIVVRDRSAVFPGSGALRFTVGTPEENDRLLDALLAFPALGPATVPPTDPQPEPNA